MNTFQTKMNTITQALGVLMVFVLIFPTALVNIVLLLLLLSYVASGDFSGKWQRIRSHSVAKTSLFLLALFIVGVAYSSAELGYSLHTLETYRELLLLPIIMSVFTESKWQRRAYYAFFIGIGVGVLGSFVMRMGWLPPGPTEQEWVPFKGRIAFGFFLAYAVYLMIHHALQSVTTKQKLLWSSFAIVTSFDVLYLVSGRTGHIVLVALLLLLLFQYRHLFIKYWTLFLLLLAVVFTAVVNTSEAIKSRSHDIGEAEKNVENSSIGQRLIFWQSGLRIIADHPLFGAGTGSFATEFLTHANGHAEMKADNPHNEYLLIGSQLGIIGLFAFIWLLYVQFKQAAQLPAMYGFAAQGLVVAMAVGCLFNSFLRDHGEGHFYAIFAGLLFAAIPKVDA